MPDERYATFPMTRTNSTADRIRLHGLDARPIAWARREALAG
jgi:hypothetical protein